MHHAGAVDFGANEQQEELRRQTRRFLDGECPMERVREIMTADRAVDPVLWARMRELGYPSLVVPEAYGGTGLAWEDLVVVAEEAGRTLCPSPLLAHSAAARAIDRLGSEPQKAELLPGLASGETLAAPAVLEESDDLGEAGVTLAAEAADDLIVLDGVKTFVPYGQAADLLLVAARERGGVSLFAVPVASPGIVVEPLVLTDLTDRAAHVSFTAVTVDPASRLGEPGGAWPELSAVLDAATVALSAEMVGAADAACTLTAEYAKQRKQFGQPIGRFQGVKHRLAEVYVAVESARSLVYYASWAVDNMDRPARHVSMAKAYASRALDQAGEEAVQLHGGIGYTWECDAQLYYKRGRSARNLMGSPEYHYERLFQAGR